MPGHQRLNPALSTLAWVFTGGVAGTLCRVGVTGVGSDVLALVLVNATGTLILGFLTAVSPMLSDRLRPGLTLGVGTGFCGSLTTFSALSVLLAGDPPGLMVLHAVLFTGLGLTTASLGWFLGRRLVTARGGGHR